MKMASRQCSVLWKAFDSVRSAELRGQPLPVQVDLLELISDL